LLQCQNIFKESERIVNYAISEVETSKRQCKSAVSNAELKRVEIQEKLILEEDINQVDLDLKDLYSKPMEIVNIYNMFHIKYYVSFPSVFICN
jgi:hypothetical protein